MLAGHTATPNTARFCLRGGREEWHWDASAESATAGTWERSFASVSEIQSRKGEGRVPGGTVVKNLPANAEDTGSIPGLRRSHMPRSN